MKPAILLLAALAALPPVKAAAPAAANPPPPSASSGPGPQDLVYVIATNDILTIDVFQEPDLRSQSRVNAKGMVNLNLVKEVQLAGLTIVEAQQAVEKAYRDGRYLRKPQVTINIVEVAERTVSIQGEVRAPGRYPLPIETALSVADVVTKAGGFTDTANGRKVRITHFNKDGKAEVREVDVQAIIKGEAKINSNDKSLLLLPGDIVFVPINWI